MTFLYTTSRLINHPNYITLQIEPDMTQNTDLVASLESVPEIQVHSVGVQLLTVSHY